jgi:hypothetical protein
MVSPAPIPAEALHKRYKDEGGYADCYHAEISRAVDLAEFVEAFYTSPVFKIERFILKWLVFKSSTDAEAQRLARGEISQFSAWTLEARNTDQMLMKDYQGKTLSWFMVSPGNPRLLYFGTAIVASKKVKGTVYGQIPILFRATLWFHKLYSRALLWSAVKRLSVRTSAR